MKKKFTETRGFSKAVILMSIITIAAVSLTYILITPTEPQVFRSVTAAKTTQSEPNPTPQPDKNDENEQSNPDKGAMFTSGSDSGSSDDFSDGGSSDEDEQDLYSTPLPPRIIGYFGLSSDPEPKGSITGDSFVQGNPGSYDKILNIRGQYGEENFGMRLKTPNGRDLTGYVFFQTGSSESQTYDVVGSFVNKDGLFEALVEWNGQEYWISGTVSDISIASSATANTPESSRLLDR